MRVTFVRTVGAKDRVYVTRDGGGETSWEFPSYGEGLPHDLVHLVVESRFGVTRGVWGRVAAGADLARINAAANKMGGNDKYRALGDDLDQVMLAEVLANAPWLRLDEAPTVTAVLEHMSAQVAVPASVTAESIERVRAELFALREKWRALAPKGSLTFRYPLEQ